MAVFEVVKQKMKYLEIELANEEKSEAKGIICQSVIIVLSSFKFPNFHKNWMSLE